MAAQCPQLPTRSCYNCGDTGHIGISFVALHSWSVFIFLGKNCPKPNLKPPCYKCQMSGHKAADCPYGVQTARPEDAHHYPTAKYY